MAVYRVVVATNQSGIGRGLFDMATLNLMHEKMHRPAALAGGRLDAVFFCPHKNDDHCECRVQAGMYQPEIARRFDCDLTGVPAVGDLLLATREVGGGALRADPVRTGRHEDTGRGRAAGGHAGLDNPRQSPTTCSTWSPPRRCCSCAPFYLLFLFVTVAPWARCRASPSRSASRAAT